jgi:hypothetical protein
MQQISVEEVMALVSRRLIGKAGRPKLELTVLRSSLPIAAAAATK